MFREFFKACKKKFKRKKKELGYSWKTRDSDELINELVEHTGKFLNDLMNELSDMKLYDDLVDIANYCIFIATRIKHGSQIHIN